MYWSVRWKAFDVEIMDVDIQYQTKGINVASCKSATQIPTDQYVIMHNAEREEIFRGFVKKNKRTGTDINGDDIFQLDIHETPIELDQMRVGSVDGNVLTSQKAYLSPRSLDQAVYGILYGSGWTKDPSWTYPNLTEQTPPMMFYYTSKLNAVFKVLKAMYGQDVWFKDDGVHKYIYWGLVRRNWGSINGIIEDSSTEYDSIRRNVDFVKILGKSESISGQWPEGSISVSSKIAVFRWDDISNAEEAVRLAKQVYADIGVERVKITVDLNQPLQYIREADVVSISGVEYHVKSVRCTQKSTKLTLTSDDISIFDLLDGKLKEVTGEVKEGSVGTFDGGWQNVSDLAMGEWMVSINNIDYVQDFELTIQAGKYRKDLSTDLSIADVTTPRMPTQLTTQPALTYGKTALSPTDVTIDLKRSGTTGDLAKSDVTTRYLSDVTVLSQVNEASNFNQVNATNGIMLCGIIPPAFVPDEGYQFGFIVHTATIRALEYGCVASWVIKLNNDIHTTYTNMFVPADGVSHMVTLPFMIGGQYNSWGKTYYVWLTCNGLLEYFNPRVSIQLVPRHTHVIQEPSNGFGHTTPIGEPNEGWGHSHEPIDLGHENPYSDPTWSDGTVGHYTDYTEPNGGQGHDHPPSEPNGGLGHSTTEDDRTRLLNSYPRDMMVIIENSKYPGGRVLTGKLPSPAQGGPETHKVNIQDYLVTGQNKIKVWSSAAGSIYASGSYINYGVNV